MNVSLRQLRALVCLVQTGSFTHAAESMHVTQSAMSNLIKELERNIGLRLVDRSTRSVELTTAGRDFFPLVQRILRDLDAVLDGIDDLKALHRGVVRIAAPQLLACTLLPDVIAAWRLEHPGVQVRLADCDVEGVLTRVAAGEADFGIGPERPVSSEMSSRLLFDLPFVGVFPAGHALDALDAVRWIDLLEHPFIALQGQFTERLSIDLQVALHERPLHPTNEVAFMTTALSMVNAGLGVTACLPYAESLVRAFGLRMKLLHEPVLQRKVMAYERVSNTLSPAALGFKEFLFAHVAAQPAFAKKGRLGPVARR